MSDISATTRMNQQKELLNKREVFETRKMREKLDTDIKSVQKLNDKEIDKIRSDYEVSVSQTKSESETKLAKLRHNWDIKIADENKRYEKLLTDLKTDHGATAVEIQVSNEDAIARQGAKHQEYLERARLKFEEEKAKLEG